MKNIKGFTLLELLIAAAIIGSLVVLATSSYRSSAADAYVAAAKGQTEMLGGAVQRFLLENRVSTRTEGQVQTLAGAGACQTDILSPATLIGCGFVENVGWDNPYFEFYICTGQDNCSASSTVTNKVGARPFAYMKGTAHPRMPERYGTNYRYWIGPLGTYEVQ